MKQKNYFPSNGTEFMIFTTYNCDLCYKEKFCTILTNSFLDKEPNQWIYGEDGYHTCTSLREERQKYERKVKVSKEQLSIEL